MLVSILIPCFNAERWIASCIESALAQTWPEKEVIVLDDGSSDRSLEVIRSFGSRIRMETGPNQGGNAARNRLLELARGEWVQYLDADDYLLPEKIAIQAVHLRTHPSSDLVVSPVAWERMQEGAQVRSETPIDGPDDPWVMLAGWKLPQTGGPLWRKDAILRAGGWRVEQPCCQEHELYLRLLESGAVITICQGCYAVYRDIADPSRVTRKLASEVHHQRLHILKRMETFLGSNGSLTALRKQAINNARHGLARHIWHVDRATAVHALNHIEQSDPGFTPTAGPAAPWHYRIAFQLFGFSVAEAIASWVRPLMQRSATPSVQSPV